MDIFDTKAIRADMERDTEAENHAYESCHAWSVAALGGFVRAAQEVQTPVVELDMGSFAAQASGIALACWPTTSEGDKKLARYYSIVRDTSYEVWPAQDGQGLTLSTDGQVFLMGKACSVDVAARWMCRITGNSLDSAKGVFDSALRGRPVAIS